MKLTYDNIREFLKGYFEIFNKYGQNPKTNYRMNDYFHPDLEFVEYSEGVPPILGRERLLAEVSEHTSSHEKLIPEEIVVDERRGVAVVLIKTEITDAITGELLVAKSYLVHYQLVLDQSNTIKIKRILLFEEQLTPGKLDVGDVFMRDRKKHNSID